MCAGRLCAHPGLAFTAASAPTLHPPTHPRPRPAGTSCLAAPAAARWCTAWRCSTPRASSPTSSPSQTSSSEGKEESAAAAPPPRCRSRCLARWAAPRLPPDCSRLMASPHTHTHTPRRLTFCLWYRCLSYRRRYLYDHVDGMGPLADASITDIGFIKGAVISVGGCRWACCWACWGCWGCWGLGAGDSHAGTPPRGIPPPSLTHSPTFPSPSSSSLPAPAPPPSRPPAPPPQVRPETPALDAMVLMEEKNISAVAVVNAAGSIIGNFSISELRCAAGRV